MNKILLLSGSNFGEAYNIILLEEGKPRNWKYMKKYAKK